MKKTFEQFFLSEEDVFTNPNSNPDAYTNQEVTHTGGGRVANYPVSRSSFNWLKTKSGAFTAGYLSGYTESEVAQIFLGTTLSASYYKEQYYLYDVTLYNEYQTASAADTAYFYDVWSPAVDALNAQVAAYLAADNVAAAVAAQQQFNATIDAEYDRLVAVTTSIVERRSAVLSNLSDYLESGKIPDTDPYKLDDPNVAAALQRKKRNEQIDRQIEELKKDNERLKSQQAVRAAQAIIGLGFDIATAIAILNVFSGPADEAAIISGKIGVEEILEKMAREGGKEVIEKGIQKAAQKIPTQLADDAASVTEKLLRSKGSLGDDAVKMVNKIDDALDSGSVDAVKKVMQQADDLLYGRVTPKPRVSTPTPKRYKIDPKKYDPKNNPAYGSRRGTRILDNSYEPSGKVLSEDRRFQILKEIKKPFVVPELPKKYKMNFTGKFTPQNTPDQTASIKSDELEASGNARGQKWRHHQKYWQGYETTERMNVVYDRVGHGDQAWNKIIGEAKKKNGWRNREIQEQLNIRAHEIAMMKEDPSYVSPFIVVEEVPGTKKDPTFNRIKNRIKKVTDYPDKPSKKGYPDTPPQVTAQPYKDRSSYYNRLDPISAKSMPLQDDPNIDKKVKAARKKPK